MTTNKIMLIAGASTGIGDATAKLAVEAGNRKALVALSAAKKSGLS